MRMRRARLGQQIGARLRRLAAPGWPARASRLFGPRACVLEAAALCMLAFAWMRPAGAAPVFGYEVIASYPHDREAFTEGLIAKDGFLYESTGLYGESSVRKVDLETGAILKRIDLAENEFGEGLTALRDTLFLLTWYNHIAYSYVESDSFDAIGSFAYPWSGWGLTRDNTHLVTSDGTARIRFLDPRTFALESFITVRDGDTSIRELNELEYIGRRIYANVWYSDQVAVIDPASGNVEAWLDLGGLRDSVAYDPDIDVLNGIAFDPSAGRLFVTGKRWPKVFEIRVPTLQEIDDASLRIVENVRCLPNPCPARGLIVLEMPAEASLALDLVDPAGRLVRRLVDGRVPAGARTIPWDASGIPSGTYFLRLSSEGRTRSRAIRVLQ